MATKKSVKDIAPKKTVKGGATSKRATARPRARSGSRPATKISPGASSRSERAATPRVPAVAMTRRKVGLGMP